MATKTPAIAAPIDSENTAGYRPKLQCLVLKCSQDRKFPSESALRSVHFSPTTNLMPALTHFRKHKAKHKKPYICQVLNCKHTCFGDKGGLDRHNRNAHGPQTHCCLITLCKRHVRGFPRKYNVFEH
jgi:hypothetical protein